MALLSATGCSRRVEVEWAAARGALTVTARGFPGENLAVITGAPTGPLLRVEAPRYWTTIGAQPPPHHDIPWTPFDPEGVATVTLRMDDVGPGSTLVQAVVLGHASPHVPLAVGDCMALRWEAGLPVLQRHVWQVLFSGTTVTCLVAVALVIAGILLRRLRIESPSAWARRAALGVVVLLAASMILGRLLASPAYRGPVRGEPFRPFWPEPLPLAEQRLHPFDRVTRAGLFELIERTRSHAPADGAIHVIPDRSDGPALRDAMEVTWMLWPRATGILPAGTDPHVLRGTYVVLGGGPPPRTATATILHKNAAGALWSVSEGEPR